MTKNVLIITLTLPFSVFISYRVCYGCTSVIIHKDIGYDSRPMAHKTMDWSWEDGISVRKYTSYGGYMALGGAPNIVSANGRVGFVNDLHGGGTQDASSFFLDLMTNSPATMSAFKNYVEQNNPDYGYNCWVVCPGDVRLWESHTGVANYEYDPVNPTRQSQSDFSGNHKYVIRANGGFFRNDHKEPQSTVDTWSSGEQYDYRSMKTGVSNAVNSGGKVTVEELLDISRGAHIKSRSVSAGIILGVKSTEDKKYQTFLYAHGHSTYAIYVPVWYDINESDLSSYVTESKVDGDTSIAYWVEESRGYFNRSWFQDNIIEPVETNIIEGVKDARTKWFAGASIQTSFSDQITFMHNYGTAAAYHTSRSAYVTKMSSTSCNTPPQIISLGESTSGNTLTISPTVNETCSSYVIEWGDGATDTGTEITSSSHTYSGAGHRTYHVMLYVRDNNSTYAAANIKWKYITIDEIDAPPSKPMRLHIE